VCVRVCVCDGGRVHMSEVWYPGSAAICRAQRVGGRALQRRQLAASFRWPLWRPTPVQLPKHIVSLKRPSLLRVSFLSRPVIFPLYMQTITTHTHTPFPSPNHAPTLSAKHLKKFTQDLLDGKLTPEFKSAAIPDEPLDGGVTVGMAGAGRTGRGRAGWSAGACTGLHSLPCQPTYTATPTAPASAFSP
jgi:hypothetical protein